MVVGCGGFFWLMIGKIQVWGTHQIVPTIVLALVAFILGSYIGKKPDDETLAAFWGGE